MIDRVQNTSDSEQVFSRIFLVGSFRTKVFAGVAIYIYKNITKSVLKNYLKMFSESFRVTNAAMFFCFKVTCLQTVQ